MDIFGKSLSPFHSRMLCVNFGEIPDPIVMDKKITVYTMTKDQSDKQSNEVPGIKQRRVVNFVVVLLENLKSCQLIQSFKP